MFNLNMDQSRHLVVFLFFQTKTVESTSVGFELQSFKYKASCLTTGPRLKTLSSDRNVHTPAVTVIIVKHILSSFITWTTWLTTNSYTIRFTTSGAY